MRNISSTEAKLENYLARFDRFWDVYPLKVGKRKARILWLRLKPSQKLTNEIIEAVKTQKQSEQWQERNGVFIQWPATWLSQSRWEDNLS